METRNRIRNNIARALMYGALAIGSCVCIYAILEVYLHEGFWFMAKVITSQSAIIGGVAICMYLIMIVADFVKNKLKK